MAFQKRSSPLKVKSMLTTLNSPKFSSRIKISQNSGEGTIKLKDKQNMTFAVHRLDLDKMQQSSSLRNTL